MITPIFANKISYQNQYSNQRVQQPSFKSCWGGMCSSSATKSAYKGDALKYISGQIRWSRETASRFEELIVNDRNFEEALIHNFGRIREYIESNFTNPFNCKVLLNYPQYITPNRIFENPDIHKGLASISYATEEDLQKLRLFFQYCSENLLLKEFQFFPKEGIREAIKHENIDYLSFLMNERMLIPETKNGEIDVQTIMLGRNSKNPAIRMFFDNDFLMHKARKHEYFSRGLYNEPPFREIKFTYDDVIKSEEELSRMDPRQQMEFWAQDNNMDTIKRMRADDEYYRQLHRFPKTEPKILDEPIYSQEEIKKCFKTIISDIRADEDTYGQAQLATLYSIVHRNEFGLIKDAPLNLSGGRLQHLLAELYINPTDREEVNAVKAIIGRLKNVGANLDAFDDLGETALKRAVDAENVVVVESLLENGANPYACERGADSARKVAEISSNINIFNLFERHDLRR